MFRCILFSPLWKWITLQESLLDYHATDYPNEEWNSISPCENVSNGFPGGVEIVCAERFYLDNISSHPVCIPLCESWLKPSREDVAHTVSLIIVMISSAVLFLLLWPQKDTM